MPIPNTGNEAKAFADHDASAGLAILSQQDSEIDAGKLTLPYSQHDAKQQRELLEFHLSISGNFKIPSRSLARSLSDSLSDQLAVMGQRRSAQRPLAVSKRLHTSERES